MKLGPSEEATARHIDRLKANLVNLQALNEHRVRVIARLVAQIDAIACVVRGMIDAGNKADASIERLRTAVVFVIETLEKDEAQGYHTKDRAFVITILRKALATSERHTVGEYVADYTMPSQTEISAFSKELDELKANSRVVSHAVEKTVLGTEWDACEHEWKLAPGDWDLPDERSNVVCTKCGVPGERDDRTGNVHWPAT